MVFQGGKSLGKSRQAQPPGAAAAQDVEDRVEDLADAVQARSSGGFGGGQVIFEATPLGVGEVALVCFSHAR